MTVVRSIVWLAVIACSAPAPSGPANVGTGPAAPAKPPTVRVQLAYRETFSIGPPFARVPPFTLLDDGTLIDIDEKTQMVMATRLPKAEADRIARAVLDLGFERLESHTESCKDIG